MYEGAVEVIFKNKDLAPVRLEFTGKITPVLEVRPVPAFFIATTRGHTIQVLWKSSTRTPNMQITQGEFPSSRYDLKLVR